MTVQVNPFHANKFLSFQASFKNEKLVLICKDDSDEELNTIILYYKHKNDDDFQEVALAPKSADHKADEYRLEHFIPDAKTGEYICKVQSKCEFGLSEISTEEHVLKVITRFTSLLQFLTKFCSQRSHILNKTAIMKQ